MHKHLLAYNELYFFVLNFCIIFVLVSIRVGCRSLYVIHWSSGCEDHNNYRQDLW